MKILSIYVFLVILLSNNVYAQDLKIIDGDTVVLNGVKIRFSGIDAPETNFRGKSQKCISNQKMINCGELSKKYLIKIIGKNKINCILEKKKDQFKRNVGECFIKNTSISKLLVKNGYAFDYPKYSKNKFLKDQNFAKLNKLGLWKTDFQFPWVFRANLR